MEKRVVEEVTIEVIEADITSLEVDAIVNAANTHLVHGGGLAAVIARRGGSIITKESDAWVREHGPLSAGTAATTSAGQMPARTVIHVAGPRYRGHGTEEVALRAAVRAALQTAATNGARSLAIPAISAGIFGYPVADATAIIADEVVAWARSHPYPSEILLVGISAEVSEAFQAGLAKVV